MTGNVTLNERLEAALGERVIVSAPLPVGFGLEGMKVRLSDGRHLAVKAAFQSENCCCSKGLWATPLEMEAYMLRELRRLSDLPVPAVHHCGPELLVMDFIENDGGAITPPVERDAAAKVAALHGIRGKRFGYPRDTLIGALPQRNRQSERWIPFFAECRLMEMARQAHAEGPLPAQDLARIERLAAHLDEFLIEPEGPCLLHGDLWTGNVLVRKDRIAGIIDPAISFGHPEIELAFTTLFGTFGATFFDAYEEIRPLEPGFHKLRKDLYNLHPLLVHVRLFGASYLTRIDTTLRRIGF